MAIEGTTASFEPRIKLGMVGGGSGAFIGAVHRIAARIDDHYDFVAGALSSTPEKSRQSGAELGLHPSRIYDDFKSMAIREAQAEGRHRGGVDRDAEPHALSRRRRNFSAAASM